MTEVRACRDCGCQIDKAQLCWPCYYKGLDQANLPTNWPCSMCGSVKFGHSRYCDPCMGIVSDAAPEEIQAALVEIREWIS